MSFFQAAGVTSLIKMVMMLRNNSVPPQPGAPFRMNRKFPPLQKMNVEIPFTSISLQPAPGSDGKRKMLLSNFDASVSFVALSSPSPRSSVITYKSACFRVGGKHMLDC